MDSSKKGVTDAQLEAFRGSALVEQLLSEMTLQDKVGEMTQLTLDMLCVGEWKEEPQKHIELEEPHRLDENHLQEAFEEGRIGSVLNCGATRIQRRNGAN